MKPKIHPRWYPEATVTCVCGNKWTVGATVPAIRTDICSNCHPFFTGEQRIVDTEGQVDRFMRRLRARDESLQEIERRRAERTSPELLLTELGLKSRVLKLLTESDVTTAGGALAILQESGDDGLTDIRGFGLRALADLKKALRARGFVLPGDEVEAETPPQAEAA
ncbi:MAG: 50S ribosomal protein L31 [Chloroflexota bacterium]|nr:50S ribosomal protein L31 [Chloroflexota bacterium]